MNTQFISTVEVGRGCTYWTLDTIRKYTSSTLPSALGLPNQMTSLSDILLPWNHTEQPNNLFLTFRNSDDCIVHVPVTTSNVQNLRNYSDTLILSELNEQMARRFGSKDQEYGPLLLPGSIFFVDTSHRPRRKVNSYRECNDETSSYNEKEEEEEDSKETLHQTDDNNNNNDIVNLKNRLIDLTELEKLSVIFTNRRIAMNLSQADVINSLGKLYGVHRSVSLISRFERMDLSLSNYLKVYPIILKWLKDSATADGRDKIIRSVVNSQSCSNENDNADALADTTAADDDTTDNDDIESLIKQHSPQPENPTFSKFTKRRPRTIIPNSIRRELERIYRQNQQITRYDFKELANKFNVDKTVIKVWFYNRRTRTLQMNRKMRLKRAKRTR
ncbi:unnamed protein product [Schistosoma turkestanicum]|nr:unnamed protein product [Schistosoma turkestanicum]